MVEMTKHLTNLLAEMDFRPGFALRASPRRVQALGNDRVEVTPILAFPKSAPPKSGGTGDQISPYRVLREGKGIQYREFPTGIGTGCAQDLP